MSEGYDTCHHYALYALVTANYEIITKFSGNITYLFANIKCL